MARPKKNKKSLRSKPMQIRLLQKEERLFKEAADNAGLSLSAWARERLLLAAKKEL